jgi:predicted dehydrogenase
MTALNQGLPSPAATYVDSRELIRDKNVGIVVIETPGYLHKQLALEAIRAGKDILLEKPPATTYADATDIVREAKRSKRVVAVRMQRRVCSAGDSRA